MEIVWQAIVMTLIPNVGGIIGGFIAKDAIKDWAKYLNKPSWNPPDWVFGPVWTTLYTAMGFASYLVWRDGGGLSGPAGIPLAAFGIHLIINWLWTPIFFGCRSVKWGFYWIVLLWIAAAISGVLMYQVNHVAGYIMIPYMVWLSYAGSISLYIFLNNPDGGKVHSSRHEKK